MKEVYDKINTLTNQIEVYTTQLISEYEERLQNIRDYVELHNIDEVLRDDILNLADGEAKRICSHCSKPMAQGYCIENGLEYYCSDDCLREHYTDEEYNRLYDDGNGDSYWTEW